MERNFQERLFSLGKLTIKKKPTTPTRQVRMPSITKIHLHALKFPRPFMCTKPYERIPEKAPPMTLIK